MALEDEKAAKETSKRSRRRNKEMKKEGRLGG